LINLGFITPEVSVQIPEMQPAVQIPGA
jgi:hypothetical protein